jgi:hypothetical protein
LYVGGGLESIINKEGIYFGETFNCLVIDHYKRIQAGDAYFFTHDSNPLKFTEDQLKAIREFTQSHLICAVTEVEAVQKDAFHEQTDDNPRVPCSSYQPFDFSKFGKKRSGRNKNRHGRI